MTSRTRVDPTESKNRATVVAVQVQIESPRVATSRPCAISIEEVHDNEPAHANGHRPQVEEPDEGDPNLSQACLALLSKT